MAPLLAGLQFSQGMVDDRCLSRDEAIWIKGFGHAVPSVPVCPPQIALPLTPPSLVNLRFVAGSAEELLFCHAAELNALRRCCSSTFHSAEVAMNGVIYIVGLIVVVLAILSFLGLR